jgi:DNA-directed RNA polymerase I subunit RPA43
MSIETPADITNPTMGSEEKRSKPEKKEKKRKREHGEHGHKSKSKKHKKTDLQMGAVEVPSVPSTSSPFHVQTSSLYLPLAPISQKYPLEGMCAEHISPLILTYYPPFNGVILSYSKPRLSEKAFGNDGAECLLKNIDEYAVSWSWVTAEFLLFKPEKGAWLEGYVNLQNQGHLGLVCWNLFNASIEAKRLPPDWRWKDAHELQNEGGEGQRETYAEEGAGYFVDGEGNKVEGMVKFRVKEIESSHDRERGFLSIEGTMLSEEADAQMLESEKEGTRNSRDNAGRRLGGSKALGATDLSVPVEVDLMDVDTAAKKHRRKY